jgi:SAM-dependent methyltransferase
VIRISPNAIATLHQDLPREAPGDDASTHEALRRLLPLPPDPVVVDLGCGPGRSSLVLAGVLNARVVAVDLHQPYLVQLERGAIALGLAHLIEIRRADFGTLDIAPGSVDLIWSEGAAYVLGFAESLRRWRPLLKPRGLMAVSELTWLTDHPPREAKIFWDRAYPSMGTVPENRRRAESAAFELLDHFVLPASAWWGEYYTPLFARVERLLPEADADLAALLAETVSEIELFRRHGDSYGYVFYLLRQYDEPNRDIIDGRSSPGT